MTQDQHKLPEPTAFVWHQHLGERTKSLRWTKPNQWEYAEKVEPLYTEAQVRELLAAHLQQCPLPVREGTPAAPGYGRRVGPWQPCEHSVMRVIEGGNPDNIADRVAFIEKTPRVRVRAFSGLPGHWADFLNWCEGLKGDGPDDLHSRAWCDHMLAALGYELDSPSLPVRQEPTPEQIAAGVNAMRYDGWHLDTEELVQTMPLVYRAMVSASPSVQNMGEGETGKDGVGACERPSIRLAEYESKAGCYHLNVAPFEWKLPDGKYTIYAVPVGVNPPTTCPPNGVAVDRHQTFSTKGKNDSQP